MKRIGSFGLAIAAALALTALAGAVTASAADTVLCKALEGGSVCAEANRYASGTSLEATSSSAKFKGKVGLATVNVTCTESAIAGETSAGSGNPLKAALSSWSLGKCTAASGTVSCTVTTEHLPYAGSAQWTANDDGTLVVGDSGKGVPGWHFGCGTTLNCTYTFSPSLTFEGGNPAQLVANEASMVPSGGTKCGTANGAFTATYAVNSPKPAYVAKIKSPPPAESTVICQKNEFPCIGSSLYLEETAIQAESSNVTIKAKVGLGTVTYACDKSVIEAETTASGGAPLPLTVKSWSLDGCHSGVSNCSTTAIGLPYDGLLKYTEKASGGLTVAGPSWEFACDSFQPDCRFSVSEADPLLEGGTLHATFTGGNPGSIVLTSIEMTASSWNEDACFKPSSVYMNGTFSVNSPNPVYVSKSS